MDRDQRDDHIEAAPHEEDVDQDGYQAAPPRDGADLVRRGSGRDRLFHGRSNAPTSCMFSLDKGTGYRLQVTAGVRSDG